MGPPLPTRVLGICCDDNKVYCVVGRHSYQTNTDNFDDGGHIRYSLRVYREEDDGLKLLDRTELEVEDLFISCCPRVDNLHRVYVPCSPGVRIFRCRFAHLQEDRDPLKCVPRAVSVAVNTVDTLFVCDKGTKSVCLVSVSADRVIRRLETPAQLGRYTPEQVAVLGATVLVCYSVNTLVIYRTDSPSPGQRLTIADGPIEVSSITTDGHSSFLVMDWRVRKVFVLDNEGKLRCRIPVLAGWLQDCAVSQSQLWVGCRGGSIDVMSSQHAE